MALAGEDVRAALDRAQALYGDRFVFGFGSIRYHWFLDLAGADLILRGQPEAFGNAGAYGFLGPVGGSTALINTDDPEHLRRRRAVQPAFHARALVEWVQLAEEAFVPFLTGPFITEPGALHPRLRPLLLDLVIDILLGRRFRRAHPGFSADVMRMMDFATLPFQAQLLKVPIPPFPWAGFIAARRRVDRALRGSIRDGVASAAPIEGALGTLGHRAPAAALSESELRDQFLSLVAAGFDTSSAAIAWWMHLLSDAELQEQARSETAGSEPIDLIQQPQSAPLHAAIFNEALRLYPPAPAILRRTLREVQSEATTLPSGAGVALSIWHLHRDERWWTDPLRVDPERWLHGGSEPRAFLPFGHGGRFCIGAGMAKALATTFCTLALREARWSPLGPAPKAVGVTLTPDTGLPLAAAPVSRSAAR